MEREGLRDTFELQSLLPAPRQGHADRARPRPRRLERGRPRRRRPAGGHAADGLGEPAGRRRPRPRGLRRRHHPRPGLLPRHGPVARLARARRRLGRLLDPGADLRLRRRGELPGRAPRRASAACRPASGASTSTPRGYFNDLVFPRLAAVAEAAWTPPPPEGLAPLRGHRPLQPEL